MYKLKGNQRRVPATFSGLLDSMINDNWGEFFNDNHLTNNSIPVNIKELDNAYQLDVVAPGLKKEDFNINIDHDLLTISFEQKEEHKETTDKMIRNEYQFRSFKRSFNLSDTINAAEISAGYTDGVLSLMLPKKEEAKKLTKKIEIS